MLTNEDYTQTVNYIIDAIHQILSDDYNRILKECLMYEKKEPFKKLKKEKKELTKRINKSNKFLINIKKTLDLFYDKILNTVSWALDQYLNHCKIELSLIVLYSVRIMLENEQEKINILLKNLYMFSEFVNNNKKQIVENCPDDYTKEKIAEQLNVY